MTGNIEKTEATPKAEQPDTKPTTEELPCFLNDDEPSDTLPVFIDRAIGYSLHDWKPGETLDDAIAREKAQKG